jgi:hypothetical protein
MYLELRYDWAEIPEMPAIGHPISGKKKSGARRFPCLCAVPTTRLTTRAIATNYPRIRNALLSESVSFFSTNNVLASVLVMFHYLWIKCCNELKHPFAIC